MFGFIADLFGYLLNALYSVFNNYGISIIVFSVILRLILLPITYSQQKSLKKNTKIQNQVKEIQNRYKNDQEKMNQEMMDLYKKEGISPFSGCLSGIVQIVLILSVFYLVSQPLTHMKNVETTEIYKEYDNKVTDNGNNKVSYKEISIINLAETDYKEIEKKLNENYAEDIPEKVIDENNEATENNTENNETVPNTENVENTENSEDNANNETTVTSENNENKVEDNEQTENKLESKEELQNKKEELEKLRLNMNFSGIDLSKVPTQSLNDYKVYIIPILYVISSFVSTRLTTKTQNKDKNQKEAEQDPMQGMSKGMTIMMPIMSVSIAVIAPLGLALYWFISNVLMIIERIVIDKIVNSKEEKENA